MQIYYTPDKLKHYSNLKKKYIKVNYSEANSRAEYNAENTFDHVV